MVLRIRQTSLRWLIIVLCQLVALQPAFSQGGTSLRIVVVEGEGAKNVSQQIAAKPLVVRIENSNRVPVAGAVVTFTAPAGGPSGEFGNDLRMISVTTAADGLASAGPYHPNAIEGPYQILVRAAFQGEMPTAAISQTNVEAGPGHKKLIAILAIAGGAAAAGIVARSKGSSSSGSGLPTITLGTAAVGAPR